VASSIEEWRAMCFVNGVETCKRSPAPICKVDPEPTQGEPPNGELPKEVLVQEEVPHTNLAINCPECASSPISHSPVPKVEPMPLPQVSPPVESNNRHYKHGYRVLKW